MIVTCPNCDTQFSLPDASYAPGRKARCSVCSYMFILPAIVPQGAQAPKADNVSLDEMNTGTGMADLDALLAAEERKEAEFAKASASLPGELDGKNTEAAQNSYADTYLKAGAKKEKKKGGCLKRLILLLLLLLCLCGLGLGVYIIYFQGKINLPFGLPFNLPGTSTSAPDPVGERISGIDKVKDLLLIDVSHKYVQNVKLGPLVVITGKVRNNFSSSKEMIRVEASLLDKKGRVLATQQQYCGIVVPDLQLQVLGQKELAQALDNRFDVLANNINVQPGAEVHFMVVFVYPPSTMAEYTVVVADVSDPPNLTPQGQAQPTPGNSP